MGALVPVRVRPRLRVPFRWLAVLPALFAVGLFAVYPTGLLFAMALFDISAIGGVFRWEFVGLDNVGRAIGDEVFRAALWNTGAFVVVTTAAQIVLGTGLAVLVGWSRVLSGVAKNVLLWPAVVAPVVVSVVWWLLLSGEFGAVNRILATVGLPTQNWLASHTLALPALMLVDVWHWTPLVFIVVYAALRNVDAELLEAGRVDGASEPRLVWHIVLPLLRPAIAAAALLRVIMGLKVFDEMHLLTGGGPGLSTTVISIYIRDVFFGRFDMGYGAALGAAVVVCGGIVIGAGAALRALAGRTRAA
jgi:multiple sugar transport system permease protein